MKEKWMIKNRAADFEAMGKRHGISPLVARLLVNRGLTQEEEIERYLHPDLTQLENPEKLKDAKRTAEILRDKIAGGKKIRIIGDYDVDGVVSTYIFMTTLTACAAEVDYVIPDRICDGYGLNLRMVEEAIADGVDTILTCDNGIAAVEQTRTAKAYGLTMLITDHHEVPEELPMADTIVNPKQQDCAYPYKGLCGAAVAYKVARLLYGMFFPGQEGELDLQIIPFAAIATVCDVMELTQENRMIVSEGLKLLRRTKHPGICALMRVNEIEPEQLSAYHLGYVLGPCLNATGRLDTAVRGVKLLMAEGAAEAEKLAYELKEMNAVRKEMTAQGLEEAIRRVEQENMTQDKVLVVFLPECHESLAGIIAGKLREKYNRPSIVVTRGIQGLKGSGRSIKEYSMFEKLTGCKEYLTKFGGHPMAAGLSLEEENLELFRQKLNEQCGLSQEDLIPKISIDAVYALSGLSESLVQELACMEPFGRSNDKPVLAERKLKIRRMRGIGKVRRMLKLLVEDAYGCQMEALYFGDADEFEQDFENNYGKEELRAAYRGTSENACVSVIYYPSVNEFNGVRSLEIVIQHYMF